ncbi:MAG: TetR family transcriptional regulator [Pseudomonadota bacterium]
MDAAASMNFETLSIVQLARTLEVSEGAIYYYFPKRDDLVRAVLARSALQFVYAPLDGDWHSILSNYAVNLFDALIQKPGRARYFLGAGISNLEQMRVFVRVVAAVKASGLSLEETLRVYRLYVMTAIRAAHSHDEYHAYWDTAPAQEMEDRFHILQQATELEGVDFLPIADAADYFCERTLLVRTLAILGRGLGAEDDAYQRAWPSN